TGRHLSHGELGRCLEMVETGRIPEGHGILVENLDRLSRLPPLDTMDLLRRIVNRGVLFASVSPELLVSKDNIGSLDVLFRCLMDASLAHQASANKSRYSRAWWEDRWAHLAEKPATPVCPAWLEPIPGPPWWKAKDGAVRTLKLIARLAQDGLGATRIVRELNLRQLTTFGSGCKRWTRAYVSKLLRDERLIGEFRPCKREKGRRVPTGQVAPGYSPAVLSEEEFLAMRQAARLRTPVRGPQDKRVANLFTGLCFAAQDRLPMMVVYKGKRPYTPCLLASGAF